MPDAEFDAIAAGLPRGFECGMNLGDVVDEDHLLPFAERPLGPGGIDAE